MAADCEGIARSTIASECIQIAGRWKASNICTTYVGGIVWSFMYKSPVVYQMRINVHFNRTQIHPVHPALLTLRERPAIVLLSTELSSCLFLAFRPSFSFCRSRCNHQVGQRLRDRQADALRLQQNCWTIRT